MKEAETNSKIIIGIMLGLMFLLIVGGLFFIGTKSIGEKKEVIAPDTLEKGKQIVTIAAKVGYSPERTIAKANTPTLLRVSTNDTFDCSTALIIKQLGISKSLPATGNTDIEIPAQAPGTILKGSCSMGMYSFAVKFN